MQRLRTGQETPFYERSGIYVFSMWLEDRDGPDFTRRCPSARVRSQLTMNQGTPRLMLVQPPRWVKCV